MIKVQSRLGFTLILPALVIVITSGVLPLLAIINYSVQDVFYGNRFFWVGPQWFMEVLTSEAFLASLGRSLAYSALVLLIEIPLGLVIALSIPRTERKVTGYLVIMSIPLMIPWVVVGLTWAMLIHPQWGSLGALLSLVGLTIDMNNPMIAWLVILLVDVWHWTSLVVLLCYSGLVAIPGQYYRAAKIDGASRWAILRHIELPKLKKVLLIAILLRFIDSFMIYVEPLILTKGGPGTSTVFISHELMRNAAQQFDLGRSAAISLIYFAIILAITWTIYRTMNPKLSQS